MRPSHLWGVGLALAVLSACSGTGTVSGTLYPPQSGTISLTANNAPAGVTTVAYELDGNPLPGASQVPVAQGFNFDTTTVADGLHDLRAVGNGSGGAVTLFDNSILIVNGANSHPGQASAPTPSPLQTASPSPVPTATSDKSASGTSTATSPEQPASGASGTS